MIKVIKRNCTEVDFDKTKISTAILKSMKNGSGIIKPKIAEDVANEIEGYNQERALQQAQNIYHILMRVFDAAHTENVPTFRAADHLASERIGAIGRLKQTFTGYAGGKIRGVS